MSDVRLEILMGPLTFSPAPRAVVEALTEAQVTHAAGQRSGFQLKLRMERGGPIERLLYEGGFEPPTRVILVAIVRGTPSVISDGVIARNDVVASGTPGASALTVTGSDVSQMMDQIDLSGLPMPAMPSEAQIYFILARWAPYGVIPLVVPSPLLFVPNPLDRIPSQQGTDYAHVSMLADRAGHVFYIEPASQPGVNVAYWGPELRLGDPQPALTVGMGSATTVDSFNVSYDGMRKSQYALWLHIKAAHASIPLPVPDVTPFSPPLGSRYIPPRGFRQLNRAEAPRGDDSTAKLQLAETALRGLARATQGANVVTGSGVLDVARYGRLLQARRLVSVRGVGVMFDGTWFVRSVTTTLKPGSMTQSFSLDRNALVASSETVPV